MTAPAESATAVSRAVPGLLLLVGALLAGPAGAASQALRDVVLVLDNSGSLHEADPEKRLVPAVRAFLDGLPEDTRAGLVVFDGTARLPVPLGESVQVDRAQFAQSLTSAIDYRGQLTNTPAAVERAIDELYAQARPGAEKFLVLFTDGIVDTGAAATDAAGLSRLRGEVSATARARGVRVFSVAFTEAADRALLEHLSAQTGGETFLARDVAELDAAFGRVGAALLAAAPVGFAGTEAAVQGEPGASLPGGNAGEAGAPARDALESSVSFAEAEGSTQGDTAEWLPGVDSPQAAVPLPEPAVDESGAVPGPAAAHPDSVTSATAGSPGPAVSGQAAASVHGGNSSSRPVVTPVTGSSAPLAAREVEPSAAEASPTARQLPHSTPPATLRVAESAPPAPLTEPAAGSAPQPSQSLPSDQTARAVEDSSTRPWPALLILTVSLVSVAMLWVKRNVVGRRLVSGSAGARHTVHEGLGQGTPLVPGPVLRAVLAAGRPAIHQFSGRPVVLGGLREQTERGFDHVILEGKNLERRHAVIERRPDGLWIVDQGSRSGTFVNARRVEACPLRDGDRLRIGTVELEFLEPAPHQPRAASDALAAASAPPPRGTERGSGKPPGPARGGASVLAPDRHTVGLPTNGHAVRRGTAGVLGGAGPVDTPLEAVAAVPAAAASATSKETGKNRSVAAPAPAPASATEPASVPSIVRAAALRAADRCPEGDADATTVGPPPAIARGDTPASAMDAGRSGDCAESIRPCSDRTDRSAAGSARDTDSASSLFEALEAKSRGDSTTSRPALPVHFGEYVPGPGGERPSSRNETKDWQAAARETEAETTTDASADHGPRTSAAARGQDAQAGLGPTTTTENGKMPPDGKA